MNNALRKAPINPWLASVVSFLPIVALLGIVFVCLPRSLPTAEALVIDKFGMFGMDVHNLSIRRFLGAVLMVIGIGLIVALISSVTLINRAVACGRACATASCAISIEILVEAVRGQSGLTVATDPAAERMIAGRARTAAIAQIKPLGPPPCGLSASPIDLLGGRRGGGRRLMLYLVLVLVGGGLPRILRRSGINSSLVLRWADSRRARGMGSISTRRRSSVR
jgi:transporter family-2 protein